MNPEDLDILKRLVQARSGVVVDPLKTYAIESRLGPVARREGFDSIDELMEATRTRRDERLMWALTEAMTPSETAFFRDRAPFTAFREEILPALAAARGTEPIRIWSASCSSGQEIYSLAMLVDEDRTKFPGAKIELFGSDLSDASLEKAQAGLYTQFEVQRGLPVKLLLRNFEKAEEMWRIIPSIRQMVRWRRINLLADLTPLGRFDVIFCRYTVGLFDESTRRRALDKLAQALPEDGYLVLGEGESTAGCEGLHPVAGSPGVFTRNAAYRAVAA